MVGVVVSAFQAAEGLALATVRNGKPLSGAARYSSVTKCCNERQAV
jgi:hypothetical protein